MKNSSCFHQSVRELNLTSAKLRIKIIKWAGLATQVILFLIVMLATADLSGLAKVNIFSMMANDFIKVLVPPVLVNLAFYLMVYKPTLMREQRLLKHL